MTQLQFFSFRIICDISSYWIASKVRWGHELATFFLQTEVDWTREDLYWTVWLKIVWAVHLFSITSFIASLSLHKKPIFAIIIQYHTHDTQCLNTIIDSYELNTHTHTHIHKHTLNKHTIKSTRLQQQYTSYTFEFCQVHLPINRRVKSIFNNVLFCTITTQWISNMDFLLPWASELLEL